MDREPARELPEHHPWARPHHPPRDRGQARWRDHRAAGQDPGQPGRPVIDDRSRHPDHALCPRPERLLQDPERLRRGHRRLHQYDLRGRLPRRRPARGDLRHRAGDGPLRGGDRDGPCRASAPELRPARPVPVREPIRALHGVRRRQDRHGFGRLRTSHGQGARDGRLQRSARRRRRRPRRAASCSASACRPTSRSAASPRPSGSVRSARAGAPRCGNRPTSRCT